MSEPASVPTASDLEAYLDAAAPVLGLTVRPEWRAAVLANLTVTARFAALVAEFPVDEREEPAPVYRP
jgi:hypothetical protein